MRSAGQVALSAFWLHRYLILTSWTFILSVCAVAVYLGTRAEEFLPFILYPQSYNRYLPFFPLLLIVGYALWRLPVLRRSITQVGFWGGLKVFLQYMDEQVSSYLKSPLFWNSVAAMTAMLPFSFFFCIGKSLIPHLFTYTWDPLFAQIDKILHFGFYPHEYLVVLVDGFSLYGFFDLVYYLYFVALLGVNAYCIFLDRDPLRRFRYLWTTLISWLIGGLILASLFASTGPIFYQDFYPGISPYQGFIDYLFATAKEQDLSIVPLTRELHKWVVDESIVDINAISAMPSMHAGIIALFLFYIWDISRIARYAMMAFLILTLMAIVYLGLHYAIDGYAGVLLVWGLWRASKFFMPWIQPELKRAL